MNEAFLRLVDLQQIRWRNRAHFFAMAARLMRRILVEDARARAFRKRGGGAPHVTFDENVRSLQLTPDHIVALDDALKALAVTHGFRFVSDPASTSVNHFALIGHERNGVYF